MAAPFEPFVAQRFAVAVAVGDRQPRIFHELLPRGKAGRVLDDGAEDVRADDADAGDLLELADLPELPAHAATGRCRKVRKDLEQCRAVQTKHMRLGFFRKEGLRYNVWRYTIQM
jgi:hypothetical protein